MGIAKVFMERGWQLIPNHNKEIIKQSLLDFKNKSQNKQDALNKLFEMYNLYMGGNYRASSQTCGTCVRTVVTVFTNQVKKEYGE